MISIEPVSCSNVALLKSVRLRALKDSPRAFGSTYAKESQLTDEEWIRRAQNWNGERGIGFLALDQNIACGIAGCFIDQDDPTLALLVSMWTAPAHRRLGIGRMLVQKIIDWLAARGVQSLRLMVTSVNESAMRFYERLGFSRTGRTEAYPNDPAIIEYEMSRSVG